MNQQAPVIGHVIITCRRCDQPRHIPVACAARPVPTTSTYTWTVTSRGEKVGVMHLAFTALPDGHRCAEGNPPGVALRLVQEAPGDQTD